MAETLSEVWQGLARTVPNHVRQASWQALCSATAQKDFVDEHASELCRLVLYSLECYTDSSTQRAILATVRHCIQSQPFLKEFTAALVKLEKNKSTPGSIGALLRWSGLILQVIDLSTAQKAASKLIECQATWLAYLATLETRKGPAQHAVGAALVHSSSRLLDMYISVATAKASAPLVQVIWGYASKHKDVAVKVSQPLLQIFVEAVLSAKEVPPQTTLACYTKLLADASESDVMATLVPAFLRMIRRSPEAALGASTFMLCTLTRDLSTAAATDMLPALLQQARHAKETVRRLSVEATGALSGKIKDPTALLACITAVIAMLDGSESQKIKKITSPQERASVIAVLEALAAAPGRGSAVSAAATTAVDFISRFYKEEITEDGKLALLRALGAWLPRCSALPASALTRLSEGLAEKETLRRGHLRALSRSLSTNVDLRPQAAALAPALGKLVVDGAAKVATRVDGLFALLCAAYIAGADAGADGALEKGGVWAAVAAENSPLLAPSTASKLAPEEAAVHAELCGALLISHLGRLKGAAAAASSSGAVAASRSLVLLLLHYSAVVRGAAVTAAAAVAASSTDHVMMLLDALQYWLSTTTTNTTTTTTTASNVLQHPGDGDVPMSLKAMHERYFHSLLACLPKKQPCTASIVSAALLLAHHPLIAAARRSNIAGHGCGTWNAVAAQLGDTTTTTADIITSQPDAVLQGIIAALSGSDSRHQAAAFGALNAASAVAAPQLLRPVLTALQPFLDRTAHDELSARQLRVYATPRGKTSNENEDGSIIPVELFEEMLADKSTISPPIFPPSMETLLLADDEKVATKANGPSSTAVRPSQQVAAAGNARGGGKSAGKGPVKDPAAEARAKQLRFEAEMRAGVVAIREKLATGLTALGAFASGASPSSFTVDHLGELAAPALPLLTSPLVGGTTAFECVSKLAACISGPPGYIAVDIAAALRLVAQTDASGGDYQRLARQRCIERSVHALLKATGGRPATDYGTATQGNTQLAGPVYLFCFPILRAVLSCPRPTLLHDAALGVVALHVGADSSVSKQQAFELLYHVLEILPSLRERVLVLLRMLCSSIASEDEEGLVAALKGITGSKPFARAAALSALQSVPVLNGGAPTASDAIALLWMAGSDVNEDNATAGKALWESSAAVLPFQFVPALAVYLTSVHEDVRAAAASALAAGLEVHPTASAVAIAAAVDVYEQHSSSDRSAAAALGAAAALTALASHLSAVDVTTAMDFLLSSGLVDRDQDIRSKMVAAGVAIVDAAGLPAAPTMLPLFESYLERKAASGGLSEEQYDYVRQGAVVFLGTLARHLDPGNPKVKSIVDTLIEVLKTPSEAVQRSVSDCLPPLISALQKDAAYVDTTVQLLLQQALLGGSYGDRRGAAFGLAGAVKGLGLSSLKAYGIMDALKAGVEEKGDAAAREGALSSFECLSAKLGRLFEPYVISILPTLLTAFGDPSPDVRDAANGASRVIMGQLSAQGVKLVLPALLKGVEDRTWRTKQGSIQLLGAMAHCAPKQLSVALPTIVPRLGEVLADPHPKVSAAAKQALNEVGSVILNPEVAQLVPTLLAALGDPSRHNKVALDTLLSTVFVNTIDAASLAVVIPVVHRGLRDRSGDVKKRAARIVGNLCKLVNDPKDMAPYVTLLLPDIQAALIDPLPEVRATAAKALGSLTLGMGTEALGDIEPWLLERMQSDSSAVERSGTAQGLAEVLAVQGPGALGQILPEVIAGCSSRSAAAREGCLTLFKYLPYSMTDVFRPHLPVTLPCVLDGLADESEGVRDASLSAGRVAVELYYNSSLPLLMPTVEAGTINENWRIRQSSIELLGDLLFKVAGTTGRIQQDVNDEEGEGISVEAHGQAIIDALGMAKRNEVLARIYMARSDVAYTVRSAALHVWKTLVTNTPKTLTELLPALMDLVIQGLACGDVDRGEMAALCLGELVRKMGDRVLVQILPILKQGTQSEDAARRRGVCNGLREVMENSTRTQLADHLADLLPAVQGALCDEDAEVRAAAGGVINILFKSGGGAAIDSVIPSLLHGLDSHSEAQSAQALEGLRVVLGVRPQLLSAMAPKLIKTPVTASNLRALGALAEVAGPAIHSHLSILMPALLMEAAQHPDVSPAAAAAHAALQSIAGAVQEDGLHLFMAEVHKGLDESSPRRAGAAAAIVAFCKVTKLDYQEHVPGLISSLIALLTEEDHDWLVGIWSALSSVMASIPKEMAPSFVRTLKEAVAVAREKEKRKLRSAAAVTSLTALTIPGFCLPKALSPVLPVYLQGVLQGSSAELRELAAEGLGELIEVTGEEALKPFVVQITGPLIRIIGDRFPWQTKAAILKTMGLLVGRAGAGLRPFIPQLQSTFVKCLSDPAQGVRQRAAINLGDLTKMALRLDQLVSDLAAGAVSAEPAVAEAYLTAIEGSLVASGDRLAPETMGKVGAAVRQAVTGAGEDEVLLRAAAGALGAYSARCAPQELRELLEAGPLTPIKTGKYGERLGSALIAAAVAQRSGSAIAAADFRAAFLQSVAKLSKDESIDVKQAAGKAAGRLVAAELEEVSSSSSGGNGGDAPSLPDVVTIIVALLGPDQHSEVQKQALAMLRRLSAVGVEALVPFYADLVPSVLSMIQDSSGTTKLSAERTLARVLQLDQGIEAAQLYLTSGGKPGALAKQMLTETYLRRLARLPALEEDDLYDFTV